MSNSKFAFTRLCAGLALAVAAIGSAAAAAQETARYVVEFKPGMAAAARAALAQAGGRIKLEIIGGEAVAIELPKHLIETLKKHGAIAAISEDAIRTPFSTAAVAGEKYLAGQTVPYGITMVQANLLSDANTANRTLCIIDSGYDLQHEDLKDNNVTGEFDTGTGWWYTDETHHGSHVAGTIAARGDNGTGVETTGPCGARRAGALGGADEGGRERLAPLPWALYRSCREPCDGSILRGDVRDCNAG